MTECNSNKQSSTNAKFDSDYRSKRDNEDPLSESVVSNHLSAL